MRYFQLFLLLFLLILFQRCSEKELANATIEVILYDEYKQRTSDTLYLLKQEIENEKTIYTYHWRDLESRTATNTLSGLYQKVDFISEKHIVVDSVPCQLIRKVDLEVPVYVYECDDPGSHDEDFWVWFNKDYGLLKLLSVTGPGKLTYNHLNFKPAINFQALPPAIDLPPPVQKNE